jgi:hypothetical protein
MIWYDVIWYDMIWSIKKLYSYPLQLPAAAYTVHSDCSQPTAETDLFPSYHGFTTPMDALINSWRAYLVLDSPTDAWWNQYLTILNSLGPFGEESWVTVHLSTLWLLDYSFLVDPDTLYNASTKFRYRWRAMIYLRKRFNSEILQQIQYSSAPNIASDTDRIT